MLIMEEALCQDDLFRRGAVQYDELVMKVHVCKELVLDIMSGLLEPEIAW